VTVSGGTLSNFATVDGDSYTATFTADDGVETTGSVSVGIGYEDAVGNAGTAGTDTVTIDTLNPTVVITPDGTTTTDSPIVFTFQFSETVSGFVAGDVSITNGSAGTFTPVDGDTFTLKVTPTAPGTVTVSVAAGEAQDGAGNDNVSGSASVTSSAAGEVTLPGGGTFEVLIDGADLVLKLAGGAEQFRRSLESVTVLEISGTAGDEVVTILNSGGVVSTPILFIGKGGADQFDGTLATGPATLIGGAGDDTLTGGSADDFMIGGSGKDVLSGNGGNDHVFGRSGRDTLTSYCQLLCLSVGWFRRRFLWMDCFQRNVAASFL
jgi:Ca2+-binding RTX toxin-like protein